MSESMIERVARAIEASLGYNGEVYDINYTARAAIEAMREPTDAMVEAGCDADIPGGRYGEPTFRDSNVDENDVPVIWNAMVDAALAEQQS